MRKKLAIVMAASLALVLAVSLIVPVAAAPNPLAEPGQQSPRELSVLMLPADFSGESSLAWQSTGWGPWWKPKPPPPEEPSVNKWAVVIGIADYEGREYDLWHADEDAKEMTQALMTKYGFPEGNIKLLLNRQATAGAIVSAIYWLAERQDANSTVVFFFSGHGFWAPDNDYNHDGIPDDGWDDDVEVDGIDEGIVSYDLYGLSDGDLNALFSAFETEKFALIFGSCYSGGMFDSWLDKHGRPTSDPKRAVTPVDLQAPGRVISSACKADQEAWDYFFLRNTLFGYYFVDEGILDGKADGAVAGEKDGNISMEEAWAYAAPLVTAEQPDSEPQIYDDFAGELVP